MGRERVLKVVPGWIKVIQNIILHCQFEIWEVVAHPSNGRESTRRPLMIYLALYAQDVY